MAEYSLDIEAVAERHWKPEEMAYLVGQYETCPTSGRLHFQGYVQFKKAIGYRKVQDLLEIGNARLDAPRGSPEQNKIYCTKDDTRLEGPFEFGEMSYTGKRNDLHELVELVQAGLPERDLLEHHPVAAALHLHHLRRVRSLYPPPKPVPVVILLYGHPGCGKTSLAESEFSAFDYYRKPGVGDWFDGYDSHDVMCFEDFKGASTHLRLDLFLRYVDRYAEQVPTKGGHVWFVPKVILITTSVHPSQWYDFAGRPSEMWAVARRIHRVVVFSMVQRSTTCREYRALAEVNPLMYGHPTMFDQGVYKILKGDAIGDWFYNDFHDPFPYLPGKLRYWCPSSEKSEK